MDRLRHDLRLAFRGLRRTPTFAVAVLVILSLGIGMAVAMFTTFRTVLVRRLPVRDQDRIAVLWTYHVPAAEISAPATDLPEVRRSSRTMRDVAGVVHWGAVSAPFIDGDQALLLRQALVTSNYFDVLGARPLLGRLLRPDDEAPGAPRVTVLSYGVWQSQFGGSPDVVGRRLVEPYLRVTYTVVGVAPPGLDYPIGVGCWTPLARDDGRQVLGVARLASGASLDAARAEFFSIVNRLQPGWKLEGAGAKTFTTAVLGDVRPTLVALTAAVALLLLIACVNVGNLFLVRAASRAGELAVRRALGASYGDLVRQLVVESAVLAAAGGALGAGCAAALLRALVAAAPPQLPRLDEVQLHGNLLGAAVGVTTLAVLLFGVLPALVAARVNLESPLRLDTRSGAETRRRRRGRDGLVASQIALALVLLAGAGLLARSLQRLEQLDLGYQSEHLSIVAIAFDWTKYDSPEKMVGWGEQVERRIGTISGVSAVTPIVVPPFVGPSIWLGSIDAEGPTPGENGATMDVPMETAGAQYFRTFDTPVLRGRGFLESDREGAPAVVVVSQSVARRLWPGQDPVGKRIRNTPEPWPPGVEIPKGYYDWRTVVGVVPDTRFRALRETSPAVYMPWRQFGGWQGSFAVRSIGNAAGLTAAIRVAVRDVDPTLALWDVRPMDELLARPLAEPRLSALLLTAFGAAALVLAAVGLFGVMASAVREQTREIGIRVALGATPALIRRTVLRHAIAVAGAGACVGLATALATTRLLRSLLFEVSPADPLTLGVVCAVLIAVALLAAYVPARRATRVDPVDALRTE